MLADQVEPYGLYPGVLPIPLACSEFIAEQRKAESQRALSMVDPGISLYSRHHLAELLGEVSTIDEKIAEAERRSDAATERHTALGERISELRAIATGAPQVHDPALVEALASDPSAALDPAALQSAADIRQAQREAADQSLSQIALFEASQARITSEIASIGEEIGTLKDGREEAWRKFVREAHGQLLHKFRADFRQLADAVLAPLSALAALEEPDRSRIVQRFSAGRINEQSLLVIDRLENGPLRRSTGNRPMGAPDDWKPPMVADSVWREDKLYPIPAAAAAPALKRFLNELRDQG